MRRRPVHEDPAAMDDALAAFERVCRAFTEPRFYPHPVTAVQRIDTHISAVFLTGQWVYKLKKPVDFGFLDFTDLEARCRFCHREVALNRRFSRGVYEKVVEVRRGHSGILSLDGPGELMECAVLMKQLPADRSLQALVASGALEEAQCRALGERLAAFYAQAERNEEIRRFGTLTVIRRNVLENFEQTEPFVESVLDAEKWHLVRNVNEAFMEAHKDLFDRRLGDERICDGHGDLRSEHVYFLDDGLQIIDAIEFNDRFRFGDAAADLAFLHMDLDARGAFPQSLIVLDAYVRGARDPSFYRVVDFYACYRAMVRVKVSCLRLQELNEEKGKGPNGEESGRCRSQAAQYLELAYTYAVTMTRPTLYVFCGLPASGKSYHAERLAQAFRMALFQSDAVRREVFPESFKAVPEKSAYGARLYRKERRRLVYSHLLNQAHEELKERRSVVLDATFAEKKWREEALRLARDHDAAFIIVECRCSRDTLEKRLAARDGHLTLSDARLQHLPHFLKEYEPLDEPFPAESHTVCHTEGDPEDIFYRLLASLYAMQCSQARSRLEQSR
uniref:Aminoglycoside phosphotransferase domain-containing protein n=1 Tax=Desulfacinum infernum TaxID=35837 RepID=A0A832A3G5_9BACT